MASADFKRKGDFSEIVLPYLLAQALHTRFTGMFRAERESIIKVIYFKEGEIAFASSNQPSDRLGEVLIKRGQLSREQLDMAMSKLEANVSLGKMLVELGYLSPKELLEGAKTQVEEILFSLNTWGDGTFEFIEGPLPQRIVDLKLNTRQVIFQGIMQLDDRRWVLGEIGSMESVFAPSPQLTEVSQNLRLEPDVQQVIANVNGTHTVRDLSSRSRLDDFTVGKVVAALKCLDLVEQVEHEAATVPGGEFLATTREHEEAGDDDTLVTEIPTEAREPLSGRFETAEQPAAGIETAEEERLIGDDDEGFGRPAEPEDEVEDELEEEEELLAGDYTEKGRRKWLLPAILVGVAAIAGGSWFAFLREPGQSQQQGDVTPTPTSTVLTPPPPKITPPPVATSASPVAGASPAVTPAPTRAAATTPAPTRAAAATPAPTRVAAATPPPRRTPPPVPARTATPRPTAPRPTPRPTRVAAATPMRPTPPPPVRTATPVPTPPSRTTAPSTGSVDFANTQAATQARASLQQGRYPEAARSFRSALGNKRVYSLQLEIICQEKSITTGWGHAGGSGDYFVIPLTYRGRPCYRAMWGRFPSKQAARNAFPSVPLFFRQQTGGRAYVVPLGASRR